MNGTGQRDNPIYNGKKGGEAPYYLQNVMMAQRQRISVHRGPQVRVRDLSPDGDSDRGQYQGWRPVPDIVTEIRPVAAAAEVGLTDREMEGERLLRTRQDDAARMQKRAEARRARAAEIRKARATWPSIPERQAAWYGLPRQYRNQFADRIPIYAPVEGGRGYRIIGAV